MLVIKEKQHLAMKLGDPTRVLACIPAAKVISVQGTELVLVPHRQDEVQVLRNLGIKAPAPIHYYYDWPGRFAPYTHQRQTAAFLTMNARGLVLNEIGTGKTQSALWAADYLMRIGVVRKVLIISPLSTLERVWGDGVFMGFPGRRHVVLHGAADRRRKLLGTDADFYIINHDGFPIIADETVGKFDLVIIDEAAVYRTPGTSRFRQLRRWLGQQPNIRIWPMTGTPTPNAPTDAWALAQIIGAPDCPRSFTRFRDLTMTKIGMYKWVPRPDSTETVRQILTPAVRYERDECFDLPGTVFQTRQVPLTPTQRTYYDRMMKQLVVDLATHKINGAPQISAANEAVKMQKLVQIACGVAYDDNGGNVEIDCGPRLRAVEEVISEVGGKVILFVPLTGALHFLADKLSKQWSIGVINGAVSATKRNEIFHNFQNEANPTILIAHPATMAHGLTLTAASTIIWYGPITSNEQYTQANGRIERIGKHHVSNVVHIEATILEHQMYKRLESKQKTQGLLLDLIKRRTEE